MNLAEVVRYQRLSFQRTRLMISFGVTALIGIALIIADTRDAFEWLWRLQNLILIVYGAHCVGASVVQERVARTWDLQRLTPLSSLELSLGKLIGPACFAAVLWCLFLPWSMLAAVMARDLHLAHLLARVLELPCAVLVAYALSLMVSAYSEKPGISGMSSLGGVVGFVVYQFYFMSDLFTKPDVAHVRDYSFEFWGVSVHAVLFLSLSGLLLGSWSFLAAKWRIGKDLLEKSRSWHLPVFLAFLVFYLEGIYRSYPRSTESGIIPILWAVLFVYMASIFSPERRDEWKDWLRSRVREGYFARMPRWILGWLTLVALVIVLSLIPASGEHLRERTTGMLLLAFFSCRDLSLLQLCRFSKSRKPELFALIILFLLYAIPMVLMKFLPDSLSYFFWPLPERRVGLIAGLVPGLMQAILGVVLVVGVARRVVPQRPAA